MKKVTIEYWVYSRDDWNDGTFEMQVSDNETEENILEMAEEKKPHTLCRNLKIRA